MLSSYPHLTIRNHTYYARFSIPKHLVEIAKRKNFYYSLYTKDYTQALHKVKEYAYKTDLLIQSYERKYQEMLKLKHKNTEEIKLCLTYTEVQHIFVKWWQEVLSKIVRYESDIKAGKKTFKDFCFYRPIPLTDIERLADVEYETPDGETIFETLIKQDVYDGYKVRTIEEERIANPSAYEKSIQLYEYIHKILKRDIANKKVDREIVEILQDNPNSLLYVFNKDDYEIIGNTDEDLQEVLERHKGEEDYDAKKQVLEHLTQMIDDNKWFNTQYSKYLKINEGADVKSAKTKASSTKVSVKPSAKTRPTKASAKKVSSKTIKKK